MKTTLLSAIPAALVLAFMTFTAEGQTSPTVATGIAYVTSQRVLNESVFAHAELSKVQALQQQKNTELRSKQQEIDATRQQYAAAADGETRARLLKQEQDQRAELERAAAQAQAEVQRVQRDVQVVVQSRVKAALDEVAKTQNIRLVLNADSSVVWSAPGMDITNTLIDRMNAEAATPK